MKKMRKSFMKTSLGFIMSNRWRICFLSLFWSGKSPISPGTVGSFVALILAFPILFFSQNTLFLLALLLGLVAIRQIDAFEKESGIHDPSWIVIDELVGLWIALSFIPLSAMSMIAAFVFFRIFDIWKPSWVGYFDAQVKGGLGVVGDDVLAGVLAGLVTAGMIKIWSFLGF